MFRTAIIYLNCIKWFVTGTQCVYCEVGTELYCISFFSLLLLVLARGFVEESFAASSSIVSAMRMCRHLLVHTALYITVCTKYCR
jgi:hypothetical protein